MSDIHSNSPILRAVTAELRKYKKMAEGAFAQLEDRHFFIRLNPEQNSIYVIVQHLSGNMLSRFTDFLTTDGEKPSRDRDKEFVEQTVSREELMKLWERGWKCVFDSLENLRDADLGKTVYVRGEAHSAFEAINRQSAHYAYHVGQIVLLAKHFKDGGWKYLTIPPGQSQQFNQAMGVDAKT